MEFLEPRLLLTARPLQAADAVPGHELHVDAASYDAGSILVWFQADAETAMAKPEVTKSMGRSFSRLPQLREVRLRDGVSVEDALNAYQADDRVLFAEPNYDIQLLATPNDPQFDTLWGLNNIGQTGGTFDADIDAVEAWDIHQASGDTIVAIIDSGVDYTHPDLAANMWVNPGEIAGDGIDNDGNGYIDDIHGYDFRNNDGSPMDDNNHGTHVAGTIAAVGNNGIGVTGVNWNAQIMALKFISNAGSGSTADAIAAINYAVDNGARISNNSWGFNGGISQALDSAIQNAGAAGHIFVAAAGNGDAQGNGLNNDTSPFWPANVPYDNVVSVAATDHNNQLATFSNYGATTVDLGAPGVGIRSTTIGNSYQTYNGTSMATPHVAGALALMMDQNPALSYSELIDRLLLSTEPIPALDGITVSGGRLNLARAVGPDIWGPRVKTISPDTNVFEPFSHVRLTFNEEIDVSTFTVDDVHNFTGPIGPITVTDVTPVAASNNQQFDILFATQSELGNYSLTVGADLADTIGNLMNQDGDETNGESTADQYVASFDMVPFFARVDFGTGGSPVSDGFRSASASTIYTPELGFGWLSGNLDTRDRGGAAGTDLTRDFNYTDLATFAVDVPAPGVYDVTLTMGDPLNYPRDQMGVFLEGLQYDAVDTAGSQIVTNSYTVEVTDGQLTLLLDDLGGADPWVLINGLEVVEAVPDTFGPRVVDSAPSDTAFSPLDSIQFTFDEAIDELSFTVADVISLSGPGGAITPSAVNRLSADEFEVSFAPQHTAGDYTVVIGPDIGDLAGNLMNQDGDANGGETPDDQYTTTISVSPAPPFEKHLDFGPSYAPVAAGYAPVFTDTDYSSSLGHGWLSGSLDSRDRGTSAGDDLRRDFIYTGTATFAVDVSAAGYYEVTVSMGDGFNYPREQMGVFLEGILYDSVDTAGAEVVTNTYVVEVIDGQLTLLLDDLGGDDPWLLINGVDIAIAAADTTGPSVVDSSPDGETFGSLDRITVVFDEAVNASSFTVEDVVDLSGPNGAITPTAVNQISASSFDVVFPAQTAPGDYSLTFGPDVVDLRGNLMNQDGDNTAGETQDDQFSTTIALSPAPPFSKHLDFGPFWAPVASGYEGVFPDTDYTPALGYGWLDGTLDSRDRGTSVGDDMRRDFVNTGLATLAVDVPAAGFYEVTVSMGDGRNYPRDQMGVFLEGLQYDAVDAAGMEIVTRSYVVEVSDGQLTVALDDLGGDDPWVLINGLDVTEAPADDVGPRVISTSPDGAALGTLDQVSIKFDEAIDATTFTLGDVVSLAGPNGSIAPTAVNQRTASEFDIVFPAQTTTGDYTLVIGPDISDLAGNLMNQDGDPLPGETSDDQYRTTITLSPLPPFERDFDFGTSWSPVAAGYEAVFNTSSYDAASGFGWLSGTLDSRDRGSSVGDDVRRDFVYTGLATFAVDVPTAGFYEVTLQMGDGRNYPRDLMGVFLEGLQFDAVDAAGSEIVTRSYVVEITDGQLTLVLDDLGGDDPWVLINGLQVTEAPTDTTGPTVITSPNGEEFDTLSGITVKFDQAIDASSFTVADVVSLTGPNGPIPATAVNQRTASEFEVVFEPTTSFGDYTLVMGPEITDLAGNLMNQDGDLNPGETPDDQYSVTRQLSPPPPFSKQLDFGPNWSPVAAGYEAVLRTTSYDATRGHGWLSGYVFERDRGSSVGDDVRRDFLYTQVATFAVDVPEADFYEVTLTMGDALNYARDQMGVFFEGVQFDAVDTAGSEIVERSYVVEVTDGQLTLLLDDLGGSDIWVLINGLTVVATSAPAGAAAMADDVPLAANDLTRTDLRPPLSSSAKSNAATSRVRIPAAASAARSLDVAPPLPVAGPPASAAAIALRDEIDHLYAEAVEDLVVELEQILSEDALVLKLH